MVRAAFVACATLVAALAAPAFAETPADTTARCEEMSFRVYFRDGASTLDANAMEMMRAAERQVADCDYAELRVAVDASSPRAARRAQAIRAAADARTWDAVRVMPRAMIQRAAHRAGPDYAEVTMSPNAMANAPAPPETDAGV